MEVSGLLIKPLRIQTLCLKTLKSRGGLWEFSGVICVEVRKRTIPVFSGHLRLCLHAANSAKREIHQNYLAASLFV